MKTIDEIMYIVDGQDPFHHYDYITGRGGLGYTPQPYIHGGKLARMTGGMSNYDMYGEIVEQGVENGKLVNYDITEGNIDEYILDNEKLSIEEKNNRLLTTYYELVGLETIAPTEDTIKITLLKEYIKDVLKNPDFKEKIDGELEQNIKDLSKDYKEGKEQPVYKKSDILSSVENIKNIANKIFDALKNNNNIDLDILFDENSFEQFEKNKIKELIDKGETDESLKKYIIKSLSSKKKKDIIRGNISEDYIIPPEEGKKNKDTLLKIFTGDFDEIYNSKDDRAYAPDFFTNLFNTIDEANKIISDKKILDKIIKDKLDEWKKTYINYGDEITPEQNKNNIIRIKNLKLENLNTPDDKKKIETLEKDDKYEFKSLTEDDKDKIKKTFKSYFPIDGIGHKTLYELKSRDKNIYDNTEEALYSKTKLYGNKIDVTGYPGLYFMVYFDYNYDRTKIKEIKTKVVINDIQYGKDIQTIRKLPGGYNLIWADIDKNGTIFATPLDSQIGVIKAPRYDKLLEEKRKIYLKDLNKFLDEAIERGFLIKKKIQIV
jgi:hypothetical protein